MTVCLQKYRPWDSELQCIFKDYFFCWITRSNIKENYYFRWELKWVILITFCPASVFPSVCLSFKHFTFSTFSPEPHCRYQSSLTWDIFKWKRFTLVNIGSYNIFRGDNTWFSIDVILDEAHLGHIVWQYYECFSWSNQL